MYQAWPWGGTASASPTSGYVQPTATTQVATTQWPVGYGQYAVSPEMQQQWAAAWATQAQYANYTGNVPVGDSQSTAFAGAYPDYQAATSIAVTTNDPKKPDAANSSEKPKTSAEQPVPDVGESDKMKQLKEQAEKWTSLQQTTASWPAGNSSAANTTTVTAPNDSSKSLTSTNVTNSSSAQAMTKEEEEFERQFKDWEKQFETWKQQNQNHPDKEAFAQYEKQWEEWRVQLLQKKEQMQKAKAEQPSAGLSTSSTVADSTAATTNAAMYYQQYQSMYMQPYMYPGAVPGAVVPPAVVPPAVVPPAMVPPTGVPPVPMQPGMQMGYNVPGAAPNNFGNQGMPGAPNNENMNYDGPQEYENEFNNYGPMRGNGPRDEGMRPNFEGYDNMPPEGEYSKDDWKFGRGRGGRGRGGRGRSRGRGRWSEPGEMDARPGPMRPGRKTLLPGGPPAPEPFPDDGDGPPPFEYPTEDCRDEFSKDNSFPDNGPGANFDPQYAQDDAFPPQPFDEGYPRDQEFPDQEGFGPNRGRFPDEERFPPGRDRFPRDDRFPPDQDRFPPPKGGRFPMDNRFPPEDGRFPDRFPPRRMMDDGGFGEFDQYPPEDEMYGPPPFRDDFPPFEERGGGRGRGRFHGRGRRFRGDFDRFGPPFPPRMRNDSYGPQDFPPGPDDRFGFPRDGPPRMPPPPRGMRPPFEPPFGPDEPFFGDGPGPQRSGPQRFKSIDYTHRSAAAVMGDDYNPHYEFESEFQDDVNDYRDNFSLGVNTAPNEPIIFSQVSFESFDYGHGLKPMTSATHEGRECFKDDNPLASAAKGFDAPFHRDRSPAFQDRNFDIDRNAEFSERDSFRDRDRFRDRERSHDRNRDIDRDRDRKDSNRDNRDRDRDRDTKGRGRDRDFKRDRDWDGDAKRDDEDKRFKWDKDRDDDREFSKDKSSRSSSKKETDSKSADTGSQYKPSSDIFKNDSETVLVEDILVEPKRSSRPKQLVIILRGLPGSGKTYFAKLIKNKEIENGGSAPRMLSLDDYFMVETEVTEIDPDTGKRVKRKDFKFEYEYEMEETYRSSLFKSFKKTIDDRFFPFIIVDAVHEKTKQYENYWSYAKQKGFQVYIAEMDCKDPVICHKRNIHNRTLEDITKILNQWERKPRHFIAMDVRSLLQDVSITEVEMEVESSEKPLEEITLDDEDDSEESNLFPGHEPSKWEKLEATEAKLDQLDGLRVNKKKHSSMEDYLQLPDDYDDRKCEPGKKRVRWADLEQRKEQDRLRAIGFVVGQTDWTKLTDPTQADKALTKTKYF